MEYTKCNLCHGDDYKLLFKNYDRLHENPGVFNIVKCKNCELVYLNPRPKNIKKYYPTEYEPYNIDRKDFYEFLVSKLMTSYYRKDKKMLDYLNSFLYEKIYTPVPEEFRGKILDVGCANGVYLYNLRNQGWDVYGIEPSQEAVNFARNKFALKNVKQGFLEDNNYPDEFFDVVTLRHVIEHLPDPKEAIMEIKRILKKGGLLIITTPNFDSINEKIFKQFWFPLETPRHLYLFTLKTMRKLLKVSDLTIIKTKYDISTYSLARSLNYCLGNKDTIRKLLKKIKIVFLPITFIFALSKKSDVVTFYAKKNYGEEKTS